MEEFIEFITKIIVLEYYLTSISLVWSLWLLQLIISLCERLLSLRTLNFTFLRRSYFLILDSTFHILFFYIILLLKGFNFLVLDYFYFASEIIISHMFIRKLTKVMKLTNGDSSYHFFGEVYRRQTILMLNKYPSIFSGLSLILILVVRSEWL